MDWKVCQEVGGGKIFFNFWDFLKIFYFYFFNFLIFKKIFLKFLPVFLPDMSFSLCRKRIEYVNSNLWSLLIQTQQNPVPTNQKTQRRIQYEAEQGRAFHPQHHHRGYHRFDGDWLRQICP